MNKKILILLLLPMLLMSSCGKDDEGIPSGGDDRRAIRFEMSIQGGQADGLRVATDKNFKSTWEVNDQIGIFAVKRASTNTTATLQPFNNYIQNVVLTYDGSEWNGNIYYPNDGDVLDFYAYYPYYDRNGYPELVNPCNINFVVKADQRTDSDYSTSDFLWAKDNNGGGGYGKGSTVSLTFTHALSLVQVEAKREVNVAPFTDDLTVTLTNARINAAFNLNGTVNSTGTSGNIIMYKVAGLDYTYRALVPAHTLDASAKVLFTQNTTDKKIDMEYPDIASAALTAKTAHKYSVTLGWGIDPNHVYAVGDVYPHVGPAIGIVYEITPDGKHGKVVGLDEPSTALHFTDQYNYYNVQLNSMWANGRVSTKTLSEFISGANLNWSINFPATGWVHSKNATVVDYSNVDATGIWYLPATYELEGLYCVFNGETPQEWQSTNKSPFSANLAAQAAFNKKLTDAGGKALDNSKGYWTSTGYGFYYRIDFDNDGELLRSSAKQNVRGIMAF